jgi:hypothetical protein
VPPEAPFVLAASETGPKNISLCLTPATAYHPAPRRPPPERRGWACRGR